MPNKNIDDIKNILKSAIPANDDSKPKNSEHTVPITITAHDNGMIAINGTNHKSTHNHIWGFVLLPILFVFATIIVMSVIHIDAARAGRFSETVAIVAKCENKTANTVHCELRRTYGYDRYSAMTLMDYHRAMRELSARKCN